MKKTNNDLYGQTDTLCLSVTKWTLTLLSIENEKKMRYKWVSSQNKVCNKATYEYLVKKIDPGMTRTRNLQSWNLTHYQLCYRAVYFGDFHTFMKRVSVQLLQDR